MTVQRNTYQVGSHDDPFASDFSQHRIQEESTALAVLQWHRGIPAAAEPGVVNPRVNGGWFMDVKSLGTLGITDIRNPIAPFQYTRVKFGNNTAPTEGWIAHSLPLAFVKSAFFWEERDTGKAFPPKEFDKRKAVGQERTLRGRTRALVGIRPLLEAQHIAQPVMLSVRGSFSKAVNGILRHLEAMAKEATAIRRGTGRDGVIPKEAFWLDVHAGDMVEMGSGSQVSQGALPTIDTPSLITRDYLVQHFVETQYRGEGGVWDIWAEMYGDKVEMRVASESELEAAPAPEPTSLPEEARRLAPSEWMGWARDFVRKQAAKSEGEPRRGQEYLRRLARFGWADNPANGLTVACAVLGRELVTTADITNGELHALCLLLVHNDAMAVMDAFFPPEA